MVGEPCRDNDNYKQCDMYKFEYIINNNQHISLLNRIADSNI